MDPPVCGKCRDGYQLAKKLNPDDETRCYPLGDNLNCAQLDKNQDFADCLVCEEGYGRIPGPNNVYVCSRVVIPHCGEYNKDGSN